MTDRAANQAQTVYKADPTMMESMHKAKENIWSICGKHMHCKVRVQLMDGQLINGTIAGADHRYLYLRLDAPAATPVRDFPYSPYPYAYPYRQFIFPFASAILPLVLFDLLVITLLV